MEGGDGRGGARLKLCRSERCLFHRGQRFLYLYNPGLRARAGVSEKPGVSGPNPGYSAPPESSEQIFKEFGFCRDLEGFLCDKCEPEQYQHFGLATSKQGEQ
jgi:hypothetical protein